MYPLSYSDRVKVKKALGGVKVEQPTEGMYGENTVFQD
ncbi:hypothetical protein SLEP1_g57739 [Rubroshorea leprosula]|uniref:Uncharacterized protein n=1 Tax=Rubroshorea leprosula TaxID=152421 RepID=A0AAV5MQE6_9ROSI|nr:hypothetical protein SLEP1_g57729 [Rubroshorea leprosula]GKV51063.1 hypothetical protein SLEP1_g57739 [Rubroshorea leprosula]